MEIKMVPDSPCNPGKADFSLQPIPHQANLNPFGYRQLSVHVRPGSLQTPVAIP